MTAHEDGMTREHKQRLERVINDDTPLAHMVALVQEMAPPGSEQADAAKGCAEHWAAICETRDLLLALPDLSALTAAKEGPTPIGDAQDARYPVARVIDFESADFGDMSVKVVKVIIGASVSVGDELYALALTEPQTKEGE